jgi:hypothetical protein
MLQLFLQLGSGQSSGHGTTMYNKCDILKRITLDLEGWVAKSVSRQLATAVLWVRIQTSLKNHKWAT